eukprot:symbB.v1.2.040535.t1/scaffold7314.1/size11987/1
MALALVIKNGFKFPEVPENRREVAEMLMKLEPFVEQLKEKHSEMSHVLTGNPFLAYATNEATNETKEIAITPIDSILKLKKNSLVRFGLPQVSVNERMWFLKNGVNGEMPLQKDMNRKIVKNWLPKTPLLTFSVRGQGGGARGVRKEKVDKKKKIADNMENVKGNEIFNDRRFVECHKLMSDFWTRGEQDAVKAFDELMGSLDHHSLMKIETSIAPASGGSTEYKLMKASEWMFGANLRYVKAVKQTADGYIESAELTAQSIFDMATRQTAKTDEQFDLNALREIVKKHKNIKEGYEMALKQMKAPQDTQMPPA